MKLELPWRVYTPNSDFARQFATVKGVEACVNDLMVEMGEPYTVQHWDSVQDIWVGADEMSAGQALAANQMLHAEFVPPTWPMGSGPIIRMADVEIEGELVDGRVRVRVRQLRHGTEMRSQLFPDVAKRGLRLQVLLDEALVYDGYSDGEDYGFPLEIRQALFRVAQRPDAADALEFIESIGIGGPSCGCGADHWSCDDDPEADPDGDAAEASEVGA